MFLTNKTKTFSNPQNKQKKYSLVWNQPLGTQSTPAESHEQQPGWSQHPEPSQRSQKSPDDQLHVSLMTRDPECTGLLSRSSFYQWHGCAQRNPNPLPSAFNPVRNLLAWVKAFYTKIDWTQAQIPIFISKSAWFGFCQPRSLSWQLSSRHLYFSNCFSVCRILGSNRLYSWVFWPFFTVCKFSSPSHTVAHQLSLDKNVDFLKTSSFYNGTSNLTVNLPVGTALRHVWIKGWYNWFLSRENAVSRLPLGPGHLTEVCISSRQMSGQISPLCLCHRGW